MIQEMTYTLGHSVDGYSDDDFVLEILALGMTIEWLQPQIDSVNYTLSMVGGKEEKTQKVIALELNISQAYVSKLEKDCLFKIKKYIQEEDLKNGVLGKNQYFNY